MCNCAAMRWIPDIITENGRWPIPTHHPDCEDYKAVLFTVVKYDGSSCVMEPHEAKTMIEESDEEYETETVYITRGQFENLPEFQGF